MKTYIIIILSINILRLVVRLIREIINHKTYDHIIASIVLISAHILALVFISISTLN